MNERGRQMHPNERACFSRRRLLPFALAPALLPFVPRRARGATGAKRPSNLVVVFHPNGLEAGWQPRGGEADFQLSPVLAPLEKHRAKLVIVGGLRGGIRNEVQGHAQGMTSLWTGAQVANDADLAGHVSFDQIAAGRIGAGTSFRSLEFGVQTTPGLKIENTNVMIYAGDKKPMQAEDDPNRMFARLFGTAATPAELERLKKEKGSVLDLVRAQLADVRTAYGAEDRRILDQHAEHVGQIERRLQSLGMSTCDRRFNRHNRTGDQATRQTSLFPEMARLQTDLLALALSCGLTRVASLQLTNSTSDTRIPGVNDAVGLHGVMHTRPLAEKVKINRWFVEQLAALLDRLEAEKLPDGTTLLDDTLVVWGTEMGVGNHLNAPIPFVLAGGGAGGPFKLGRWVNLPDGPRHTRLLVTVLHALGVTDVETLGDLRGPTDRGPIEALWR